MEMETPCEISDFFEELRLYIESPTTDETQTWNDIENLRDEIGKITQVNRSSAIGFKEALKQTEQLTSYKYVELREQQNHLKKILSDKERFLATFKKTNREVNENLKGELEGKIEDEQSAHRTRMEELKQQTESTKKRHKVTFEQLNNDLEMKSASIDLEQDEMETTHRKELIDLSSAMRRHRNMCPDLQDDINVLQKQIKKREQARNALIANQPKVFHPRGNNTSVTYSPISRPSIFNLPSRQSNCSTPDPPDVYPRFKTNKQTNPAQFQRPAFRQHSSRIIHQFHFNYPDNIQERASSRSSTSSSSSFHPKKIANECSSSSYLNQSAELSYEQFATQISQSDTTSFKKPQPVEKTVPKRPQIDLSESWIDAISEMTEDFTEAYEEKGTHKPDYPAASLSNSKEASKLKSILKKPESVLHTPLFGIPRGMGSRPRTGNNRNRRREEQMKNKTMEEEQKMKVWKKRKLFDPDNLDYLDDMDLGE